MTRLNGRYALTLMAASSVVTSLLAGGGGVATAATSVAAPHRGGTLTAVENSALAGFWDVGFDPATNTSERTDDPEMEAIYGDLFQQGPAGKIVPDLATGYKFVNGGKTVDILLRHGVTFQDGTPFNASAVAFNIRRDLDPKNACICDSSFPVKSITTEGNYTVVMNLRRVFSPIIQAFTASAPNWIASPTALRKMGEKAFAVKPVGAGPFEVVSDKFSTELVLKKYNNYWQKGHPYLDGLIFKSVGNDNSAYDALVSGQAQLEQEPTAIPVVDTAKKNPKLAVTTIPGTNAGCVTLNTFHGPFTNIKAREAIYYATDPVALNKALIHGTGTYSQSGDGPGSLFPDLKVPGYRTYNLAKAKALVKQLGGLSFSLLSLGTAQLSDEALQSEWQQAGMKVTITQGDAVFLQDFKNGSWNAANLGCGGIDPALGNSGTYFVYYSTAPFTGIHDKHLDKLINGATGTLNVAAQAKIYKQLFEYVAKNAYAPTTYIAPTYNMATKTAHGPGVSTPQTYAFWNDVWVDG